MATIIAFPRATTPRRETSLDYHHLTTLATLCTEQELTTMLPSAHTLADMLRSIADRLDRLHD